MRLIKMVRQAVQAVALEILLALRVEQAALAVTLAAATLQMMVYLLVAEEAQAQSALQAIR